MASAPARLHEEDAEPALVGGSAIAGSAAGFWAAGPVGALVGAAIGSSAWTSGQDASRIQQFAPQIGGAAVTCATFCIAGPVVAVAAGAAATGGGYFARWERKAKIEATEKVASAAIEKVGGAASMLYASASERLVSSKPHWADPIEKILQVL